MKKTLAEIAKIVEGKLIGNGETVITGISGIKEAQEGDLTFLANPKYLPLAKGTKASAVIVGKDVAIEGKSVIQTDNPSLAFSAIVGLIKDDLSPKIKGIHPSAVIDPSVNLGEGVGIGPCVVIEPGAKVGRKSILCAGVYLGTKSVVGENCLVYPNVTIREDVIIGNNVIIHSGSVVGSDGFGYFQEGDRHLKIPQMGIVVIEDDVEIGACVTIDRARFDRTRIGRGTKIDNLVQIAHNVHTGENCIIIAQVGIAGSSTLGNNVIVAGQAGITGHVSLGDRAIVAAQSGVSKDVPPGVMVSGYPADEFRKASKTLAHVQRLPQYVEDIKDLKLKVAQLEEELRKLNVRKAEINQP